MSPELVAALERMERGKVVRGRRRRDVLAYPQHGDGGERAFWESWRTQRVVRSRMEARAVGLTVPCWACGDLYTREIVRQRNCGACIAKRRRPHALPLVLLGVALAVVSAACGHADKRVTAPSLFSDVAAAHDAAPIHTHSVPAGVLPAVRHATVKAPPCPRATRCFSPD